MAKQYDPFAEPLLVRPYMYAPRPDGLGLKAAELLVYARLVKGCSGDDCYVGGLAELAHWALCTIQQVVRILARLQATPLYPDKPTGPKLLRAPRTAGRNVAYKVNFPAGGWPGSTYIAVYGWMLAEDLGANELLVYAKVYGYYHAWLHMGKGRGVHDRALPALAAELCISRATLTRALKYLREPHDGKPARLLRSKANTRLVGVEGREHEEYDAVYSANEAYVEAATGLCNLERGLLLNQRRMRRDMCMANERPTESQQQGARATAANRYWHRLADILGVPVADIRPALPWAKDSFW